MAVDGILVEPLIPPTETHLKHRKGKLAKSETDGTGEAWLDEQESWNDLIKKRARNRIFFDHLYIAKDGGLTEIASKPELWYSSRYVSSLILVIFVFYNIYFIIRADLYPKPQSGSSTTPFAAKDTYLLTTSLVSLFGIDLGARPERIVFVCELAGLILLILKALFEFYRIIRHSGYYRHYSLASLCWRTFPDLSSYSAIKLLQFVVPQRLSYDLNYIMWYEPAETKMFKLVLFIVRTPVVLVIGLDCFLIKVRGAHDHIYALNADPMTVVLPVIVLLNQILGVVQITKTINNRLYRFVFAGEDGMMTSREMVKQCVWEAMIADTIYSCKRYGLIKGTALMLSWCDDDFQMMILNETDEDDVNKCPNCKKTLVPQAMFCHHCGTPKKNEEDA